MSFGYSVGDVIAVGTLAWQLYKSCKDAPSSFQNISAEVLSMHVVLKEVEDIYTARPLGKERGARLKIILDGCSGVLHDLQSLVDKYKSLGSGERQVWVSLKYPTSEIPEYRSRMTSNIGLLNTFISTSQVFVEQKLDQMKRDLQRRGDTASIRSAYTIDSLSTDDRHAWREIRKELEKVGITIAAFDANRGFILDWLRKEVTADDIDEQPVEDVSEPSLECVRDDHSGSSASSEQVIAATTATQIASNQSQSEGQVSSEQAKTGNGSLPRIMRYIRRLVYLDNALFEAVQRRQKWRIEELIASGANINARDAQKRTPLHLAAIFGSADRSRADIIELLIRLGADIEAQEKDGDTILNVLARKHDLDTLQVLLDHGADVNTLNKFGNSPLSNSMIQSTNEEQGEAIMQLLLRSGTDPNVPNEYGWSPLHRAAYYADCRTVRLLIEHKAEVNVVNKHGQTPLLIATLLAGSRINHASEEDYADVVRHLLKNGADTGNRTTWDSRTPLHIASHSGCQKIVELLINAHAKLDVRDNQGQTALHLAVIEGQIDMAELLLQAGANPNMADKAGQSALDLAHRFHRAQLSQIISECSRGRPLYNGNWYPSG